MPNYQHHIISSLFQNLIRNEILAGAIRFDDGLDQILGDIRIICQHLFSVFRQAIPSITERWIVVMSPNTGIQTYSEDNGLRIQTFYLCISIQFIKVRNSECQICISKQFNCFCLGEAHKQCVNVFFNCPFLQQTGELMSRLHQSLIV
mgnify:CR=1 FL=1